MADDLSTRLDRVALHQLKEAALSRAPISLGTRRTSSPHEFYRYPARFTPAFARSVIDAFSKPGDFVLDPFVGGGTTAVEALLSGRQCLAADLNPLSTFVTRVKTRPLPEQSQASVRGWIGRLSSAMLLNRPVPIDERWYEKGYMKGLDTRATWRIGRVIQLALAEVDTSDRLAAGFCRCIVLRTAQWALDMRSIVPTVAEFRSAMIANGQAMLGVAIAFAASVPEAAHLPYVVQDGLPGLADAVAEFRLQKPTLVLTSPPYPGVYVNYHRWKLQGRREIPAPYWITSQLDGRGLAHYTMHARADRSLVTYFDRLRSAFEDLARLVDRRTVVVQLVGFNNPDDQLPRYLGAMNEAGFEEVALRELATADDGRLWRSVPSRRWWAEAQSRRTVVPHTAREVVLFHQPRADR